MPLDGLLIVSSLIEVYLTQKLSIAKTAFAVKKFNRKNYFTAKLVTSNIKAIFAAARATAKALIAANA
ncbi:MAG: hypothetical protein COB24_11310 [Hyphomicrobiales bacterium]|nr:MAG: hypothetical protein COB24_11310 [Hyphomicrobiales bacterium]